MSTAGVVVEVEMKALTQCLLFDVQIYPYLIIYPLAIIPFRYYNRFLRILFWVCQSCYLYWDYCAICELISACQAYERDSDGGWIDLMLDWI